MFESCRPDQQHKQPWLLPRLFVFVVSFAASPAPVTLSHDLSAVRRVPGPRTRLVYAAGVGVRGLLPLRWLQEEGEGVEV
jgi:hypothetical protein